MRSGRYEVGLSGCWCPFGSSDANQLKDMLDWIYRYFSCVNECHNSFLLANWYVFSVVFWKQVSDILVVNFYKAEFYLYCGSFWLKLFLFCEDVIEGKIADTFFIFLSENWEGFTWASNSIGQKWAVDSFENSFKLLLDSLLKDMFIAHLGFINLRKAVIFDFPLCIFIFLITNRDAIFVDCDNLSGVDMMILGKKVECVWWYFIFVTYLFLASAEHLIIVDIVFLFSVHRSDSHDHSHVLSLLLLLHC